MRGPHRAEPDRDRRAAHLVDPEHLEGRAGADHVDDRVDAARPRGSGSRSGSVRCSSASAAASTPNTASARARTRSGSGASPSIDRIADPGAAVPALVVARRPAGGRAPWWPPPRPAAPVRLRPTSPRPGAPGTSPRPRRGRRLRRPAPRGPCRRRSRRSSGTRRRSAQPWTRLVVPSIRAIAQAAPNPLSMPTTVMPAAHEASIDSSAVTPSKPAPYPVLVGHRDDRRARDAADEARERALHAGDDDDRVGGHQGVGVGQQAVDAGDADVGQPLRRVAERGQGARRTRRRRDRRRCRRPRPAPGPDRVRPARHATRRWRVAVHDGSGVRGDDRGDLLVVGPGEQHGATGLVRAARRRARRTARLSCPGRRPPRAGPGAAPGGGRRGRSRGRRRAGGAAGPPPRRARSFPPRTPVHQGPELGFVHPSILAGARAAPHRGHNVRCPCPSGSAAVSATVRPTARRALRGAALETLGPVVVAFSGGADSAFLAWAARDALGAERAPERSPRCPPRWRPTSWPTAVRWPTSGSSRWSTVATDEIDDPTYVANGGGPLRLVQVRADGRARADRVGPGGHASCSA